ncbi:hypothetical protein ACFFUE_07600 [Bergeyella porcorum]|uniref:hypothetical protein n=1 Tax=Bergeyella porcorum TaxID=1735111 RepID=UPI0035EA1366
MALAKLKTLSDGKFYCFLVLFCVEIGLLKFCLFLSIGSGFNPTSKIIYPKGFSQIKKKLLSLAPFQAGNDVIAYSLKPTA